MPHWAYLFEHPTADPRRDRLVLDGEDTRAIVVAVPSAEAAGPVAASLVAEEGVGLIELCGGFSTTDVTAVVDAVGPEVAVGHVTFAVESLPAAAAYAAAAAGRPTGSPLTTART